MKLYHLPAIEMHSVTRPELWFNLDDVKSIVNHGNDGEVITSTLRPSVTSDELADILKHLVIVNAPKPELPKFQVGDKVKFQFSDDTSYSDEIATVQKVSPDGSMVSIVYADGTEFSRWVGHNLTLVESVTQVTAPKFKVGDKVDVVSTHMPEGHGTGIIDKVDYEDSNQPYRVRVDHAYPYTWWCQLGEITHAE